MNLMYVAAMKVAVESREQGDLALLAAALAFARNARGIEPAPTLAVAVDCHGMAHVAAQPRRAVRLARSANRSY